MPPSLLVLLAILSSVQWTVQAAPKPLPSRTTTSAADTPNLCSHNNAILHKLWSIKDLTVTYSPDMTRASGTGAFTLTNTHTRFSEELKCNLRANYICEFHGTPADPGLDIWLQLNLDVAYITINQSWTCEEEESTRYTLTSCSGQVTGYVERQYSILVLMLIRSPSPRNTAFAIGVTEIILVCPDGFYEKSLPCTPIEDEGFANGIVTIAQPISGPKVTPTPRSRTLSLKTLRKRGDTMPHVVESVTDVPIKEDATPHTFPQSGPIENLELKKKTWQALVMSLGRRRSGNSRVAAFKSQPDSRPGASKPPPTKAAGGPYPLPKDNEANVKKKTQIKVVIEHLCSPSCRGWPKAPGWHLKTQRLSWSAEQNHGIVPVGGGNPVAREKDSARQRRSGGRMTIPVRPVVLEIM